MRLLLVVSAAWMIGLQSPTANAEPLKVFLLAGQSNMEGHAKVETFDYIGDDAATAPLLKKMRSEDGSHRVCDGAWISLLTGMKEKQAESFGKLIAAGVAANRSATSLYFFGIPVDKLGAPFVDSLATHPKLAQITFLDCGVDDAFAHLLAGLASTNPRLGELKIEGCGMSQAAVEGILEAWCKHVDPVKQKTYASQPRSVYDLSIRGHVEGKRHYSDFPLFNMYKKYLYKQEEQ